MPIYEEKIISPLTIRFTQQRIRTTFRDGRGVEGTIKEMVALPGEGDYDIIIETPFPSIEIMRWGPRGRKSKDKGHWFSFDNRRLYCLQRLAAAYWPKRVGAKVEVMYADDGTIRKKLDTQSEGTRVNIGHAFAQPSELIEWSWRAIVQQRAPPGQFTTEVEAMLAADDKKTGVHELMNVPSNLAGATPLEPPNDDFAAWAKAKDPECLDDVKTQDPEDFDGVPLNRTAASVAVSTQSPVSSPVASPLAAQPLSKLIEQLVVAKTSEAQRACARGTDAIKMQSEKIRPDSAVEVGVMGACGQVSRNAQTLPAPTPSLTSFSGQLVTTGWNEATATSQPGMLPHRSSPSPAVVHKLGSANGLPAQASRLPLTDTLAPKPLSQLIEQLLVLESKDAKTTIDDSVSATEPLASHAPEPQAIRAPEPEALPTTSLFGGRKSFGSRVDTDDKDRASRQTQCLPQAAPSTEASLTDLIGRLLEVKSNEKACRGEGLLKPNGQAKVELDEAMLETATPSPSHTSSDLEGTPSVDGDLRAARA